MILNAYTILSGIYIVICLGLIFIIMVQKKKSSGLGSLSGMGAAPTTYWDQNKGRHKDGKYHNYTRILGFLFIALSLVLTIVG